MDTPFITIVIDKGINFMRTGKDVDFTHVDFIDYAYGEYLKDIPMVKLISHYVKIEKQDGGYWIGYFDDNKGHHKVSLEEDSYMCLIDEEIYNAEELVIFFEGEEVDPVNVIKEITGIDHDEYISSVTYSDGTIELLEVKGKILITGLCLRNG